MAISLYVRTGGPSTAAAITAINNIFDRINRNQGGYGFWNCRGPGNDSSTTQLVMAGLAGAKAVFDDPRFSDPVRLNQLNTLATNAADAYANGSSNGNLPNDGRGYGYSPSHSPSYQQTASGLWAQIIGGYDLNSVSVQQYLRWLYLHDIIMKRSLATVIHGTMHICTTCGLRQKLTLSWKIRERSLMRAI